MSKYNCHISDFDDILDLVSKIDLKDQKDLAEDIIRRLIEKGWDVELAYTDLMVSKTEEL